MASVAIGLGTNLGDRFDNLVRALDALRHRIGRLTALSRVYVTEPIGFRDQPHFWNAAALFDTTLPLPALLGETQAIERDLGRTRTLPGGPRSIDIDILLYDDVVTHGQGLTVPHARMHERAFVLRPLADIAPAWLHPQLARTVTDLLRDVATQRAQPLEDVSRELHARLSLSAEREP